MTKPLSQITKVGILSFEVSMFFTVCDKDIAEIHEHKSDDSNLYSTLDFKTFKTKVADKDISNSGVNKLISRGSVPIDELQYTPQSQSQSFVTRIDSTDVLMAEKDGITSFTFKTQTTDRSITTNYVLAYDNESVEEFYVTYEDNGSGRIIDPTSGYEVTTMSTGSVWCPIAEEVWLCNCADHVMGSCTGVCSRGVYQTTIITYEYCGSSLGEGSSGGGIGSDSGDGEGTGGVNGDSTDGGNDLPLDGEIITKPIKDFSTTIPDCDELAKNEENPLFNQYMQELKDNTVNGTNEKGFNILYLPPTATAPEEETLVLPPPNGIVEGKPNGVSLPQNIYRKASAHNHVAGLSRGLKIFSPPDVAVLGTILDIQQNNPNADLQIEQLAHYVVTETDTENELVTYALKIESSNSELINFSKKYPKKLSDENNNILDNPNWDKRLYNEVNDIYEEEINSNFTRAKQIEGFLNFVSKLSLSATLYEKNEITDKWEKVFLDDNGVVKRTPCDEL